MSDDLISRKALLDIFSRNSIFEHITNAEGRNVIQIIKEQPTAYDVDKVVKKIKELPTHTFETYSQGYPMDEDFVDPYDVIKIVKSGGVSDD